MSNKFYITTAIDYPNGRPHMGHAYEKIVTDCYARWQRFLGDSVYFLTGTDENGQKLVKAAQEAGQETLPYVNEQVQVFRELCRDLGIQNDDFIRTTEARHVEAAQELWKRLEAKGDIYFGQYEGNYCLSCEAFYTELQAPDNMCPTHGTNLEKVKEDGYFFKLSDYADWIEKHIVEHPDFIRPQSSQKELLSRIRGEKIRDLSVSRPNAGWGIPVPSNQDYVMYTWFDALINYWSAVRDKDWWPASVHVIGKDIVWFHCVIWPSLLKAAGLELPKQVYVHGMVLGQDGRKMSKSLKNGVDPYDMIRRFPLDSFRYYILRAIPSGGDGAFVVQDLVNRHNTELANDFGNLLSRVVKLALKKGGSTWAPPQQKSAFSTEELFEGMSRSMKQREHHRALEQLWAFVNQLNLYLNDQAPWKMEEGSPELNEVLYQALRGIYQLGLLSSAFLPSISQKVLDSLGVSADSCVASQLKAWPTFQLSSPEALFPKIELKEGEQ